MQPFFTAGPAASAPTTAGPGRRLLLLTHHFPPGPAAGALRWQKLAGLAAERGWGLDVVTLDPAALSRVDWPRLEELPPGTRVYGVTRPAIALERLERLVVRGFRSLRPRKAPATAIVPPRPAGEDGGGGGDMPVIVPREQVRWRLTAPRDYVRAFDAWMYFARDAAWNRPMVTAARAVFRAGVHRAVITSGPPHMVHRAGWLVARDAGVPFVMDMRDPWSLARAIVDHLASPVWLWVAARHERAAVERAALVVANTELARSALQAAYPAARDRIVAVLNGYDPEPIPAPPPAEGTAAGRRFVIAYAGSIYLDRDPRPLFRAARQVVRELGLTPAQFGIEFIGHVERFGTAAVAALAADAGIGAYLRLGPPRPRAAMMEFLAGAAMLLSLPQDLPLTIPSKIFEYMQFPAWLLVLAKRGGATELLLRESGADVVDPADEARLAAVLRERVTQFRNGERPAPLSADGRFSRRAQAQPLFDALERLAVPGAA